MGKKEKYIYQPDDSLLNRKIQVKPKPETEIGIDQNQIFLDQLLDGIAGDGLNISKLESFTRISQNRNSVYDLIDTMAEDPTVASVIEIYCEDATETNDDGQIMWVESADKNVSEYINYLLNDLNIEKNIYKWAKCLIKYGDVYLKLFHESEYQDDNLFDTKKKSGTLNENVKVSAFNKNDSFVHFVEMIPNPAQIFELTKFGKTYAYIQAPVTSFVNKAYNTSLAFGDYTYSFKKNDVTVFTADNFVHGSLDDFTSRQAEEVNLALTSDDGEETKYTYQVKRGQSILYNSYKIWRQNMLLEYALLLNRLSKSQSVKIVNVEVADMPKNQVQAKLLATKQLFEQKSALAVDSAMNDYTNSGPTANTIFTSTRNGVGAISIQDSTNDLNVSGLEDVNLFKDKLFSSFKIPKQYLGETSDAGGFDGGTSLSLLSSRYAKTIKRIQNVLVQTVTDIINILLLDKGYSSYINKYRLRMQEPTTREEVDRKDAQINRITVVQDTMSLFDDIQDLPSRLTILKKLLGGVSTDSDILAIVDESIAKAQEQLDAEASVGAEGSSIDALDVSSADMPLDLGGESSAPLDLSPSAGPSMPMSSGSDMSASDASGAGELPTPEALGVDMVNM